MSLLELEHSSTILGQSIYQLNGSRSSFGSINPMNEPNPDLQKGGKNLIGLALGYGKLGLLFLVPSASHFLSASLHMWMEQPMVAGGMEFPLTQLCLPLPP